MGSMPRLKKKVEMNYRKGSTCESCNCEHCLHKVKYEHPRHGWELRCKIMGVKESIRYRIRDDHRCDAQELDESTCWWLKNKKQDTADAITP